MPSKFLSLLLVTAASATPLENIARQECKPCNPQGASGTNPPTLGPELSSLYLDVLQSVKDIHFRKRWEDAISARDGSFCCREELDCVNVQNLNIPMCYDKFTTQFAFPDGSWGSLTTGEYESEGGTANLLSGQYQKGSEQGDIYSNNAGEKPNTATLSIPPQWTGTGVGSAVPATEIASIVTEAPSQANSNSATTTAASDASATQDGTQNAAATSASSTGAAGQIAVSSNMSLGMSIFSAIMYTLYSL